MEAPLSASGGSEGEKQERKREHNKNLVVVVAKYKHIPTGCATPLQGGVEWSGVECWSGEAGPLSVHILVTDARYGFSLLLRVAHKFIHLGVGQAEGGDECM